MLGGAASLVAGRGSDDIGVFPCTVLGARRPEGDGARTWVARLDIGTMGCGRGFTTWLRLDVEASPSLSLLCGALREAPRLEGGLTGGGGALEVGLLEEDEGA